MRTKKGQAAMEFLMTYGWAILAAIIVIGILGVYFFRSDIMTPKGAVVNAPFYVNAWNVDVSDTGVNLELKNNGGETYTVSSVAITNAEAGGTSSTCTADTTSTAISAGGTDTFLIPCTGITAGDTFKGDITITYTKTGSTLTLTSTGSIVDSIVA